jgi:hypothetical protein
MTAFTPSVILSGLTRMNEANREAKDFGCGIGSLETSN